MNLRVGWLEIYFISFFSSDDANECSRNAINLQKGGKFIRVGGISQSQSYVPKHNLGFFFMPYMNLHGKGER